MSNDPAPQPHRQWSNYTLQFLQQLIPKTQEAKRRATLVGITLLLIVIALLALVTFPGWYVPSLIAFPWWYTPALILLAVLLIILILIGYKHPGIGFKADMKTVTTLRIISSDPKDPKSEPISKTEEIQPPKNLWDWSQLLIIPVFLLIATLVFGLIQNSIATASAADQQRETLLNNYIDTMSALILSNEQEIRMNDTFGADVRSMAQTKTLTVLRRLDGVRKGYVLKFLHDAGLFIRQPFPIVSLAGADLSGAKLQHAILRGADLAGANLTHADLTGADLSSSDLDQAVLQGTSLNGAMLFYAQMTNANLSGADLSNASLGGADLAGAILQGTTFMNTDVSGTTPPDKTGFTQENGKTVTTMWKVIPTDNLLTIAYNAGNTLPAYAVLDLNTSKLHLLYGPLAQAGASVILLPVVTSHSSCPTNYCETASVSVSSPSSFCKNAVASVSPLSSTDLMNPKLLSLQLSGIIAGLQVSLCVTFSQPVTNVKHSMDFFKVEVKANVSNANTVLLDAISNAFKVVSLRAISYTAPPSTPSQPNPPQSQWNVQQAFVGNQYFPLPVSCQNPPPPPSTNTSNPINQVSTSTFGMTGSFKGPIIDTPTITVTMQPQNASSSLRVTEEVKPSQGPNDNNVSIWNATPNVLNSWQYTVTASDPIAQTGCT